MVLVIATAIGVGVAFGLAAIAFQIWVVQTEGRHREAEWSPGGWAPDGAAGPPTVVSVPAWKPQPAGRREPEYDMEDFPAEKW